MFPSARLNSFMNLLHFVLLVAVGVNLLLLVSGWYATKYSFVFTFGILSLFATAFYSQMHFVHRSRIYLYAIVLWTAALLWSIAVLSKVIS